MKTELIVAFLTKNSRYFKETDYPTIQKELEKVDDSYFPLLLQKQYKGELWIVLSVVLILLAITYAFFSDFPFYEYVTLQYFVEGHIGLIPNLLLAWLHLALAIISLIVRKKLAVKHLKLLISQLGISQ